MTILKFIRAAALFGATLVAVGISAMLQNQNFAASSKYHVSKLP
jgi:hypothetical protein